MLETIEKQLKDLLKKVGITGEVEFTKPPNLEMGDVAFSCFGIAKKEGKNPAEVAKEKLEDFKFQISNFKLFNKVEAFGPYVNFYLNTAELAKLTLEEVSRKDYGSNNLGKGKKVLIEYPSQNTHKEFHIGHFRNVCIGNTIVQLYRANSYSMIPMNYVNDFGRHVVKCLWGIINSSKLGVAHSDIYNAENKQKMLGNIYVKSSNYISEHEDEVEHELNELQAKLEARDPEIMKLFKETRGWSIAGFRELMDEMKVQHDSIIYESDVKDRGQKIVDELIKKGIAIEGERGAIIIDLNEYNLDIALLRKSTGAGVYMTSDLGLAERKFTQYNIDESINITGTEQNHYFAQLFKVLELYGFKHKMIHIGYGLVNLPSGKMAARSGNVILYEDLRDEIFVNLKKETADRHI
ncbi:arginine--tRNA ligase, partial [Patescibacteria group bacterium]|nr:arginine--tRNA ligase [Patescibacteria group bacterium]